MMSAFAVTPSGGSSARNADDTTRIATAVVIASCDSDDADWNTATGISAAADSAHFARGERRIANATMATYTASSTMRPASSIPPTPAPNWRATKSVAACGRYGTGEPNVEKVTNVSSLAGHCGGSCWVGGASPGFSAFGNSEMRCSKYAAWYPRISRRTSLGRHAPLNSELPIFSGTNCPVEIW